MNRFEVLARQGAVQQIQYLQQQNKVAELKSDVIKLKIDGERQLNQIDQQLEQLNSDLAGIRSEQAQLNAKLIEVKVNQRNQVLRAPVDGTIFDLILTNPVTFLRINPHRLHSRLSPSTRWKQRWKFLAANRIRPRRTRCRDQHRFVPGN